MFFVVLLFNIIMKLLSSEEQQEIEDSNAKIKDLRGFDLMAFRPEDLATIDLKSLKDVDETWPPDLAPFTNSA